MVPFVVDELRFMTSLVPLQGACILEIGCGSGQFSRRMLEEGSAGSVIAHEPDLKQHAVNLQAPPTPGLKFIHSKVDELPLSTCSVNAAIMLKSLHHVPIPSMNRALLEICRVLTSGGRLYVSEPLYAGEFNEVMRLFHDEGTERAAAYKAVIRAQQDGGWEPVTEQIFEAELYFRDFEQFLARMVYGAGLAIPADTLPAVHNRFERSMQGTGARFVRQVRVNVLRKQ